MLHIHPSVVLSIEKTEGGIFMNKVIYIGFVVLIILAFAAPIAVAQNAETQGLITPQFTHISFLNSQLTISPFGEATCRGAATLYSSSQIVELTVELQKLNGSDWAPLKSWAVSGPGVPGVEIERSYYVVKGTYQIGRAHV